MRECVVGHVDTHFTPAVRIVPQHVRIAQNSVSDHSVMDVHKKVVCKKDWIKRDDTTPVVPRQLIPPMRALRPPLTPTEPFEFEHMVSAANNR